VAAPADVGPVQQPPGQGGVCGRLLLLRPSSRRSRGSRRPRSSTGPAGFEKSRNVRGSSRSGNAISSSSARIWETEAVGTSDRVTMAGSARPGRRASIARTTRFGTGANIMRTWFCGCSSELSTTSATRFSSSRASTGASMCMISSRPNRTTPPARPIKPPRRPAAGASRNIRLRQAERIAVRRQRLHGDDHRNGNARHDLRASREESRCREHSA